MMIASLLIIFAVWTAFSDATINNLVSQQMAGRNAIYRSEAKAATATSFVVETAKIVITKHSSANASSHSAHQMAPHIVVIDAADHNCVCLPKSVIVGLNLTHLLAGCNVDHSTEQSGALRETTFDSGDTSTSGEGSSVVINTPSGVFSSSAASSDGGTAAAVSGGGIASAASAAGVSSAAVANTAASGAAASASASSGSHEINKATVVGQGEGITALLTDINTATTSSKKPAAGYSSKSTSGTSNGHVITDSSEDSHAALIDEVSSNKVLGIHSSNHAGSAKASDDTYSIDDSHQCECVPAYLCDEYGYINTYGVGIIQIRSRKTNNVSEQSSFPVHKCSGHDERCCRHHEDAPRSAIAWLPERCGEVSPARLDYRRAGGQLSRLGEHPWMLAILRQNQGPEYVCGGSLIHPQLVLTAAHCVQNFVSWENLKVRAGEWDAKYPDSVYPHEDLDVVDIKIHENFNRFTLFNDIALLKLANPVELSPHINSVCLPKHHDPDYEGKQSYNIQSSQHSCYTTGWGKKSFGDSHYSTILKVAGLEMVESDQCERALRATELGRWFRLHETFTCAGGAADVDACTGDGGSPLVCRRPDGRFEQTGIVAWGMGCGRKGVPGVYADINCNLPWIRNNAKLLSIDLSEVE